MRRGNRRTPSGRFIEFTHKPLADGSILGVFRDITVGNNDITGDLHGMYKAGPGWDACSGLGSPDGTALLTRLQG